MKNYEVSMHVVDSTEEFENDITSLNELLGEGYEIITITSIKAGADRFWPRHYVWLKRLREASKQ